jgi:hypothetical protein
MGYATIVKCEKVMQTIFNPSLVSTHDQIYNRRAWMWLFSQSDFGISKVLHFVSILSWAFLDKQDPYILIYFNLRNYNF